MKRRRSGRFGSVTRENDGGRMVAVKRAYVGSEKSLVKEIGMLSKVAGSEWVVSGEARGVSIVMPYYERDMREALEGLGCKDLGCVLRGIMKGVGHMHSCGVMHCDIKPENVLLNSKGEGVLCDLGSAVTFGGKMPTGVSGCTLPYCAIERLYGSTSYTLAVDMWSVGMLAFEAATLLHLVSSGALFDVSKYVTEIGSALAARQLVGWDPAAHYASCLPYGFLAGTECTLPTLPALQPEYAMLECLIHGCLHPSPTERLTARAAIDVLCS